MYEKIEKATIYKLNDNTFANENDSIISISLKYEDSSVQNTPGYRDTDRGNAYTNFIKNIMTLLNIEEKKQIIGKNISACTQIDRLLAIR